MPLKGKFFLLGGFLILLFILIQINRFRHSTNAMVIVEPREHKFLPTVIENFNTHMDSSWDLYVFHGNSNKGFAESAVKNIYKRRVFLVPLGTDNLNADEYNALLKKKGFWEQIYAENILIFQTDTALCSKSLNKIYDFINFDYIGCSINDTTIGNKNVPKWWAGENFYGIGGLSFRKKSFTMKCIESGNSDASAEDVFYSNCLTNSPNKPVDAVQIAKFCTQNKYTHDSFGAHKTSLLKRDSMKRYNKFGEFCPEIHRIDQ
jgi:hypothetical protein